jgi:hypothetical protein
VQVSESKLHIRLRFYAEFHGNYQMISSFVRIAVPIFLTILPAFLGAQPNAENLKIVVVEGEGGINNISQHTTPLTTVRVEDEGQHPLSDATVVFALPTDGPSGAFQNGAKTLTITTNEQGLASARGLRPNTVSGEMQIHVNASYEGRTARATITQFNMTVPKAKGGSGKIVAIIALVGAAAAGGAYAGLHKGASSSPASTGQPTVSGPISITPGAGTVGPPQ